MPISLNALFGIPTREEKLTRELDREDKKFQSVMTADEQAFRSRTLEDQQSHESMLATQSEQGMDRRLKMGPELLGQELATQRAAEALRRKELKQEAIAELAMAKYPGDPEGLVKAAADFARASSAELEANTVSYLKSLGAESGAQAAGAAGIDTERRQSELASTKAAYDTALTRGKFGRAGKIGEATAETELAEQESLLQKAGLASAETRERRNSVRDRVASETSALLAGNKANVATSELEAAKATAALPLAPAAVQSELEAVALRNDPSFVTAEAQAQYQANLAKATAMGQTQSYLQSIANDPMQMRMLYGAPLPTPEQAMALQMLKAQQATGTPSGAPRIDLRKLRMHGGQ